MIDVNIMPLARLMGIRLVEQSPDKVVAEMEVREDLCTTNSILHGGAYEVGQTVPVRITGWKNTTFLGEARD